MPKLTLLRRKTFLIIFVLCLTTAIAAHAQTFTSLFSFNLTDGGTPTALVAGTDGNIYGTSWLGGSSTNCNNGCGSIFEISPGGVLTTLHSFDFTDGAGPSGLLQATDGNFYGSASQGGAYGCGTVFKMTSEGTLTTLYSFGAQPSCPNSLESTSWLIQGIDGNLYGTTEVEGANGLGMVFSITPEGVLTTLYSFGGQDGSYPNGGLVQATDGKFYGTTGSGGAYGGGTIFQITSAGELTTLYSFCAKVYCPDGNGAHGLIQATDGNFYGLTYGGGAYPQKGTIFKISSSGTLTTLYSFCSLKQCHDGSIPEGLMQAADGNIYGTTNEGGAYQEGTVFNFSAALPTLVTQHSFDSTDGANPSASLIQATDGTFYGTTPSGGGYQYGTVFSMVMAPAVTLSSNSLTFGTMPIGEASAPRTVRLKNSGTALLNISSVTISDPADFGVYWTCAAVLAKGKSCNVMPSFAPDVVGKLTSSVVITDNASNGPQTISVSGTGVEPATLTPATATFSSRAVGTTSTPKNFTVTNNQDSILTSIAISISGDFAISATTCATSLGAKSKCTISVTFTPTQTGTRTGQLSVSDAVSNSPQTSSLTGTGK